MATLLTDVFERYLMALRNTPAAEQTEMTSRSALEKLLNAAAREFASAGVNVMHEPRRAKEKGAPDFKISSNGMILGYVENKAIGENLAKVAKSDQIKKYLTLSPNILLTDYLNWLWITPGGVQEARLATPSELEGKTVRVRPERAHELQKLLQGFFGQPPQKVGTAKALAEALATRSQLLRDFLGEELVRQEKAKSGGVLMGLYTAFKQQVSHEITLREFADAFAQTLAYGLFLARLNAKPADMITLLNARQHIPAAFGLIQELVGFLDRLDQPQYADIRWVVEEVLSIINNLDLAAIHEDLAFRNRKGRRGSDARSEEEWRLFSRDPFIYFYEDYLAKYDAKMRKGRGVYYTPPPIVNFIVRAINDILKDSFGIEEGLADRKQVTVLDFATGTGTFLIEVLECIFEEIGGAESSKAPLVVREHILKNIYGFEYLIAPYTIAHLKLSQYLRDKETESRRNAGELGPHDGERFQVFLTNTLEPIDPEPNYLLPELSHETEAAQAVKDKPILVITGNPPYAGHSKNNGPAAQASISNYMQIKELTSTGEHSVPLGERNPKWLYDDYVKFIRFAETKINETDRGIVGIITNHSFLDNPTFRGMRQSLMRSFDQIWVIDLHGSVKKRAANVSGAPDENVFDIEQGVAISLFVKCPGTPKGVFRADWWGQRQEKYERAVSSSFASVDWRKLAPSHPDWLFREVDVQARAAYNVHWSLSDIMPVKVLGFQTHRDKFALGFSAAEIEARVRDMLDPSLSDEALATRYALRDNRDWRLVEARRALRALRRPYDRVVRAYLRPFDWSWGAFGPEFMDYPRRELVDHVAGRDNVQLLVSKYVNSAWRHAAVSEVVAESCAISNATKEQNYNFPLYLYPGPQLPKAQHDFLEGEDLSTGRNRTENIAPEFRSWIDKRYGFSPTPEQVFGYIYAVLYAPAYRAAYADFLRTDFPRVPFPESRHAFETLSTLGWELSEIQLMRRPPPGGSKLGGYIGRGDDKVEKPRWSEVEQTLWINANQGFAPVPREVWEFIIGGYQVLDKYLKSRKGRTLSLDEIENVEKVTNVLAFTIDQMGRIEVVYKAAFPTGGSFGTSREDTDIHSDPEVMGGEHVFRGTRVPVRAIAEMMEAGADTDEMLEGYPSLSQSRLDRARSWALENPPTPKPPVPPNFEPKIISRRRVPRRGRRDGSSTDGKARA